MQARGWLRLVAGILFAIAAVSFRYLPAPLAWYLFIGTAILFLGALFERYYYKKPQADHPGRGWEETQERFIDPETRQLVTVFYHPGTGERRYVAQSQTPGKTAN